MNAIIVDANVWISAVDSADAEQAVSRKLLGVLAKRSIRIIVPSYARLEIACALARRWGDPKQAMALTADLFRSPMIVEDSFDSATVARAIAVGTAAHLRAADALYAAIAAHRGLDLISWDRELVMRAGAKTPAAWLDR